jgi:hypothetical protein
MPPTFKRITTEEFAALVNRFDFTRRINAVHMHHTWKPERRDFRGHETIVAMWRYHTEVNRWRDLAQHITIDPEGFIWLGRNWNLPPASASGHNGSKDVGPFMFEMIGNFDHGHDGFDGEQRKTAIRVIALVQKKFGLRPETLHFHNEMSSKSCPGSSIDYGEILGEVTQVRGTLDASRSAPRLTESDEGPFGEEWIEKNRAMDEAARWLTREIPHREEPFDAEQDHEEEHYESMSRSRGGTRETGLSPEQIDMLRPHLVNLNMGQFSRDGALKTSRGDVDAIFHEHLPRELPRGEGNSHRKLRIVFFAHGGLVKESRGLEITRKHMSWWRKNDIYPIYFIWETGLFETVGQLLGRSREKGRQALTRDLWDYTTDPLLEVSVRALYGPRIWGGMKLSAELASAPGKEWGGASTAGLEGGARYVARKLKEFCDKHRDQVELHAVGHSAGSIFHAHFLPAALELGAPPFKSVHFLAPAIRVDDFRRRLAPLVGEGKGIERMTLFTMRKDFERADNCALIYRKSLLYLIYHSLEPEPECPILGLEASLREDAALRELFGLGGSGGNRGEVIWSRSESASGRNASRSESHGGFDDDPPTMNSVVRRILDKDDTATIVEYDPDKSRSSKDSSWSDEVDWPEPLNASGPWPSRPPGGQSPLGGPSPPGQGPTTPSPAPGAQRPAQSLGRRRALCVGIDEYAAAPLFGCVADTRRWESALLQLGFEHPVMLLNGQATRDAIARNLREMVQSSKAGDVVVFQYSGHGTQLPDLDGDEDAGDTPGQDEALCPFDYDSGAFFIDDDVGEIFSTIPPGVNVTCFMDCCHSGTITRFALGKTPGSDRSDTHRRPRFMRATPEMIAAHERFRGGPGGRRRVLDSGGVSLMKEILFSACLSSEVAWESNGQGEFTLHATRLLESFGVGLTNEQFEQRVREAFGPAPRQHARLYCAPGMASRPLLQPPV